MVVREGEMTKEQKATLLKRLNELEIENKWLRKKVVPNFGPAMLAVLAGGRASRGAKGAHHGM